MLERGYWYQVESGTGTQGLKRYLVLEYQVQWEQETGYYYPYCTFTGTRTVCLTQEEALQQRVMGVRAFGLLKPLGFSYYSYLYRSTSTFPCFLPQDVKISNRSPPQFL